MNPSLTWGGQYKNITEDFQPLRNSNGSRNDSGEFNVALSEPLVPNSQYIVRAHVVDSKGCAGESGNFTYSGDLSKIHLNIKL